MPEAKKAERYRSLVGLYSSLRNYPKAIDFGNRALKISRDPETQVAVSQAYYQSGNNKEAARVMNELLDGIAAKGQVPKENQLLLVQAACSKAGDNACVAKVFEKLVSNYPKPDYWSQLLTSLRKLDTDDIQKLNVMRLSTQVNVMKDARGIQGNGAARARGQTRRRSAGGSRAGFHQEGLRRRARRQREYAPARRREEGSR